MEALFSVSDIGAGIPPRFARASSILFSYQGVVKGTGLGLPVVYGIVKNTMGQSRGGHLAAEHHKGFLRSEQPMCG